MHMAGCTSTLCAKLKRPFIVVVSKWYPNLLSCLQPFWYFPIKEIIQKWFDNPRFEELRKAAIKERRGGYMDATEFQRLNAYTNGLLLNESTLLLEMGLDWGSMFKTSQHSVGIVVLK